MTMQVVVRVRPFNLHESESNQHSIIKVIDKKTIIFDPEADEDEFFFHGTKQTHRDVCKRVKKKLLMEYDRIYDWESLNEHIYEENMKSLVNSVMQGFNCSVFVYGATGAGKTHTMLGNDSTAGITYLTMKHLFTQIDRLKTERKFDIGITYLEVYNEQVMNLLTKAGPLKLREDGSNGVVVGGLSLIPIFSADELLELLAKGNRNRTQHPTDANSESSRSHAIFQVHLRMTNKQNGQKNTVKLSMIDLAGSERAASTKCMGLRFKEGASINKSLLALGNCINKLADGAKHIPYRDSNLTRIIKDCLGGNCQTVMIANVSPSSITYDDTYNTLKYASRAKKIRTTCKLNIIKANMPKDFYVRKVCDLQTEVDSLRKQVHELEEKNKEILLLQQNQLNDEKPIISNKSVALTNVTDDNLTKWYSTIDDVYQKYSQSIEVTYKCLSKEKQLKLKLKLQRNMEKIKRKLPLTENELNIETNNSPGNLMEKLQMENDMKRYRQQINKTAIELSNLKKCIAEDDNLNVKLKDYILAKDLELDGIKMNVKNQHFLLMVLLFRYQEEQLLEITNLSNEIIQYDYLLLKANNLLDTSILSKYNLLKSKQIDFIDNILTESIGGATTTKQNPVNSSNLDDCNESNKTKKLLNNTLLKRCEDIDIEHLDDQDEDNVTDVMNTDEYIDIDTESEYEHNNAIDWTTTKRKIGSNNNIGSNKLFKSDHLLKNNDLYYPGKTSISSTSSASASALTSTSTSTFINEHTFLHPNNFKLSMKPSTILTTNNILNETHIISNNHQQLIDKKVLNVKPKINNILTEHNQNLRPIKPILVTKSKLSINKENKRLASRSPRLLTTTGRITKGIRTRRSVSSALNVVNGGMGGSAKKKLITPRLVRK